MPVRWSSPGLRKSRGAMAKTVTCLYLIAFVVYQTFKLNDTLTDTLLSAVQAAVNAAEKTHKESYYQERAQRALSFAELADRLGESIRETLSVIGRIVANQELGDGEKVALIDAALAARDGKPDPVERQIDEFKQQLASVHQGRLKQKRTYRSIKPCIIRWVSLVILSRIAPLEFTRHLRARP